MYKSILALCSFLFLISAAAAETIDIPDLKPGDRWVYISTAEPSPNQSILNQNRKAQKHYEIRVIRVSSTNILTSCKEHGSNSVPDESLVGPDWSKFKSIKDEETVVSQPLKFPLTVGKSWDLKFTEDRPNNFLKSLQTNLKYTVVGWEEVVVPAGKFKAVKIEATGKWKSEIEPQVSSPAGAQSAQGAAAAPQTTKPRPTSSTGRLYKAYWYVPVTKIYVKSVEESFLSSGKLHTRHTLELESYKVSE